MTIRQDTINTFKAYLLMRGEDNIYTGDTYISDYNYVNSLAVAIINVLVNDFGLVNHIFDYLDHSRSYTLIDPRKKFKKIILKLSENGSASWMIDGSNKSHNNTTMICYIMRVMYPKLKTDLALLNTNNVV